MNIGENLKLKLDLKWKLSLIEVFIKWDNFTLN